MPNDASETYFYEGENGTVMAHLTVVNHGILPAKNIVVMRNGSEAARIYLLEGGLYRSSDIEVHCENNITYASDTHNNSDLQPCMVNLTLIYEGNVVDKISTLPPYGNTCTDILLIIAAPILMLVKNKRKNRH